MTLVRPVEEETDLINLGSADLTFEDLRPEFQQKAEVLKAKVFDECPLKEMYGKALTGKVLAGLVESYVEAINKGAIPNINTAWEGVVEEERQRYFELAESEYRREVSEIELPGDIEQ